MSKIRAFFTVKPGNIPALDGYRSLAIMMIFFLHGKERIEQATGTTSFLMGLFPFRGGWVGVPLFFCLSGFLIGAEIWKEYEQTGTVDFKRFSIKRSFRIFPLFYFYFFFFILFPYKDSFTDYWQNAFFLSNIFGDNGPVPGSWSLATEEQFYLLFPVSLIIASRFKPSLKQIRIFLYVLFFVPLICRYLIWNQYLDLESYDMASYMKFIYRPIYTNCEGLVLGLILSNLWVSGKVLRPSKMIGWIILGSSMVLGIASFKSKVYFNFTGVGIAGIALLWFLLVQESWIRQVLSHPLFALVARCSFGMYLLNAAFFDYMLNAQIFPWKNVHPDIQLMMATLIALISCLLISLGLYHVLEKPFLNIRKTLLSPSQ